ncbi:MAG: pyrroline-5-carboxylate reductase [Desulfoplanes sp.]
MRVGVIGLGNMGGAIVKGLAGTPELQLAGYTPNGETGRRLAQACGMTFCESAAAVCAQSDFVILGVKPQLVRSVVQEIAAELSPDTCLISIAAGISLKKITQWSGPECAVALVMPNTPAIVGAGVFGVCLDHDRLTPEQKQGVVKIFSILGQAHVLAESQFDAFTGLIGSGPAYVMYFMEALIDAGVTQGILRSQATEMVKGLFSGTVKMCIEQDASISQLRDMSTSPAGTTMAGLNAMDKHGVRYGLLNCVEKATKRSREIGRVDG